DVLSSKNLSTILEFISYRSTLVEKSIIFNTLPTVSEFHDLKIFNFKIGNIIEKINRLISWRKIKKINPSWVNTVAFLCQIRYRKDLFDYLLKNQPELVIKFEKSSLDEDKRKKIFKNIFEKYSDKKIWFDRGKIDIDALANFIDISDDNNPTHLGTYYGITVAISLEAKGSFVYVVGFSSGLIVLAVSNPASPVFAGSASVVGPFSVHLSGNHAYVSSNTSNALVIIDISTPSNPTISGSISNGDGGARLVAPYASFVYGTHAYVASSGSNALEIVDVSDQSSPTHVASLLNGSGGAELQIPQSISVLDGYAYVGNRDVASVEIIDITNPNSPAHLTTISNGDGGALLGTPKSIILIGNYGYIASTSSNALEIISIYNVLSPIAANASSVSTTSFIANCNEISNATSGYFLDISTDNFSTFVSGYNNFSTASPSVNHLGTRWSDNPSAITCAISCHSVLCQL
ncbi:hypothetical protein IIB79_09655, partial [candidate division KSB1 bacterium]|nr:hypothetical protein [candidate division KSB1 bacterium]